MKLTEKNLELHLTGNGFSTAVGWEVPPNTDYEELLKEAKSLLKLRERIEKRIKAHQEVFDKLKNVVSYDDKQEMFKACQEDILNELEKLLENKK